MTQPSETKLLLILFEQNVSFEEIQKIFTGFQDTYRWAQVFNNKKVYAFEVPAIKAEEWQKAFEKMPEVTWALPVQSQNKIKT